MYVVITLFVDFPTFGIYALGVGGPGLKSQDTKLINSPPHWLCIATSFNY